MVYYPDLTGNLLQLVLTAAFALVGCMVLVVLLKTRKPLWGLILLVIFPPIVLYFMVDQYREVSYHGFMHASITYELFQGAHVLEDPLFAGMPLQYPYLINYIVSVMMRGIELSPGTCFALINIFSLIAVTALIYRISSLVLDLHKYSVIATIHALAGGVLVSGVGSSAFYLIGLPREVRHAAYSKFIVFGSNQLGLMFGALVILGSLQLLQFRPKSGIGYLLIAVGMCGAGLFYPPVWVVAGLTTGCVVVWQWFFANEKLRSRCWKIIFTLGISTLIVLPWVLSLTVHRSRGVISIASGEDVMSALFLALIALLPSIIIGWIQKEQLMVMWHEKRQTITALLIWVLIPFAMFVFLSLPFRDNYKFAGLGMIPLGVLSGLALYSMYETRTRWAMVYIFFLLMAPLWKYAEFPRMGWPSLDAVYSDGVWLRARNQQEDQLYQWIASSTPPESIIVDTFLTVPALARRPLYVGLDVRRDKIWVEATEMGKQPMYLVDGWNLTAEALILGATSGVTREEYWRRRDLALTFLEGESEIEDASFQELINDAGVRPVFFVAREPTVRAKLESDSRVALQFRNQQASVLKLVYSPASPGDS